MADHLDIAADREQQARDVAIKNHLNRPTETPDEDEDGNRFCLDCADQIQQERVESVNAVRCVDCADIRERKGVARHAF